MQWMKYVSFMYYGLRLLLKVQYSGDELYECESKGGYRTLQSSSSFNMVNLNGGLERSLGLIGHGYRLSLVRLHLLPQKNQHLPSLKTIVLECRKIQFVYYNCSIVLSDSPPKCVSQMPNCPLCTKGTMMHGAPTSTQIWSMMETNLLGDGDVVMGHSITILWLQHMISGIKVIVLSSLEGSVPGWSQIFSVTITDQDKGMQSALYPSVPRNTHPLFLPPKCIKRYQLHTSTTKQGPTIIRMSDHTNPIVSQSNAPNMQ